MRYNIISVLIFAVLVFTSPSVFAANTYNKSYSTGTHTLEFVDATNPGEFYAIEDGTKKTTVYNAIGGTYAIKVSGSASVTVTFNTTTPILLSKKITVSNGTLSLKLGEKHTTNTCVIRRSTAYTDEMFEVTGGTLKIDGTDNSVYFYISGNGKYTMPTSRTEMENSAGAKVWGFAQPALDGSVEGNVKAEAPIIYCHGGSVNLNHVELAYNYNNSTRAGNGNGVRGGAIRYENKTVGNFKVYNSKIHDCYAKSSGGVIYFEGGDNDNHPYLLFNGVSVSNCFTFSDLDISGTTEASNVRNTGTDFTKAEILSCTFYNNVSNRSGGVICWNGAQTDPITITSCTFRGNKGNGGGAIALYASANISKTVVDQNRSYSAGGGIWSNTYSCDKYIGGYGKFHPHNQSITFDADTQITNNIAATSGGGVAYFASPVRNGVKESKVDIVETNNEGNPIELSLKIQGALISGNTATNSGGGMYFTKEDTTPNSYVTDLRVEYGEVSANSTSYTGGAFYVKGKIPVKIGNTSGKAMNIFGNTAGTYGGAFYLDAQPMEGIPNVSITNCTIGKKNVGNTNYENYANTNGGAFYVTGGSLNVNGGTVHYNHTVAGHGGAFYLNGGSVTVSGGTIEYNEARKGSGGAIYVSNGDAVITNGTLQQNKAIMNDSNLQGNGGAVLVNGGNFTMNGGKLYKNHADKFGGGALVANGVVTFNNGTMEGNDALNGGGIFVMSGAKMSYNDGMIINNRALVGTFSSTFTTAYSGGKGKSVIGCGGGIYLQDSGDTGNPTTLTINVQKDFGLYGNLADKAGDDILAEGVNTSVTVPNVKKMSLAGFEGKDYNPTWVEDYMKNDSEYFNQSILKTPGATVDRFRELIKSGGVEQHLVDFGTASSRTFTQYSALCLGYQILELFIKANGLNKKEGAYFVVQQLSEDLKSVVKEIPVFMVGTGEGSVIRKVSNLPWASFTVRSYQKEASPWEWAYTMTPESVTKNLKIGSEIEHTFEFDFQHNQTPQHDEESKVNIMTKL